MAINAQFCWTNIALFVSLAIPCCSFAASNNEDSTDRARAMQRVTFKISPEKWQEVLAVYGGNIDQLSRGLNSKTFDQLEEFNIFRTSGDFPFRFKDGTQSIIDNTLTIAQFLIQTKLPTFTPEQQRIVVSNIFKTIQEKRHACDAQFKGKDIDASLKELRQRFGNTPPTEEDIIIYGRRTAEGVQ